MPVYDIENCGPRNRFTTPNLVLHNCLGLGFGCGWFKFIIFARAALKREPGVFEQVFGAPVSLEDTRAFVEYLMKYDKSGDRKRAWPTLSPEEQTIWVNSWLQVSAYRKTNPKIVALWKRLGDEMKRSIGGVYEIELPSGRSLRYFDVGLRGDGVTVKTTRGGSSSFATGPLLTENITQATAREVIAYAILNLEAAGVKVICHVHDEVICEVDPDYKVDDVVRIMTQPPPWAKTLPLGAEAVETLVYLK